jgi:hypothetical protein
MAKTLRWMFLFALGCATHQDIQRDYVLTGDECKIYSDATACGEHAPCHWFELGLPCQVGQPCVSGVCSGPGSGSGAGSGGAACACMGEGICFEQLGGPAMSSGGAEIQCYSTATCHDSCTGCDVITGQGTCVADPNVSALCLCDDGIR